MLTMQSGMKRRGSGSPLPFGALRRSNGHHSELEVIEESPNSSQRSDRSANDEGAILDELILGSGKKG